MIEWEWFAPTLCPGETSEQLYVHSAYGPGTVNDNLVSVEDEFAFRLLCRRMMHAYNSSVRAAHGERFRRHNPAYMNPGDLARLGLDPGDLVEIRSRRAAIHAIVEPDADVAEWTVSMTHGYGGLDESEDVAAIGSSTARLCDVEADPDGYSAQPRMSNIPVAVRHHVPEESVTCVTCD